MDQAFSRMVEKWTVRLQCEISIYPMASKMVTRHVLAEIDRTTKNLYCPSNLYCNGSRKKVFAVYGSRCLVEAMRIMKAKFAPTTLPGALARTVYKGRNYAVTVKKTREGPDQIWCDTFFFWPLDDLLAMEPPAWQGYPNCDCDTHTDFRLCSDDDDGDDDDPDNRSDASSVLTLSDDDDDGLEDASNVQADAEGEASNAGTAVEPSLDADAHTVSKAFEELL